MTSTGTGQPAEPAEVVVLGEALVDFFPDRPDRPDAAEGLESAEGAPLAQAEHFTRHLGGAGANLAVDLSRQGVKTALLGQVGGDAFGHFLRDRLRQEGVATDGLLTHRSARTGITFVSHCRGERTFLFYGAGGGASAGRPSADQQLQPGDLSSGHLRRGRLLCVGSSTMVLEPGRAATQRAVDVCRQAGMLIACDLNFRAHKWADAKEAPPLLRRLIQQCEVVKLALADIPTVLGSERTKTTAESGAEAAAARVRQLGAAVVVVTLSDRGCYLDCAAGQAHLLADPTRLVDPTGAGDAFTAGLLSIILAELGPRGDLDQRERLRALPLSALKRACARGNYLGARACSAIGATTAV